MATTQPVTRTDTGYKWSGLPTTSLPFATTTSLTRNGLLGCRVGVCRGGEGIGGLCFMHTGVTDGVINSPTPLAKFFYVPNQKLSDASSKCPILGKLANFRLL